LVAHPAFEILIDPLLCVAIRLPCRYKQETLLADATTVLSVLKLLWLKNASQAFFVILRIVVLQVI